jgi:HSP20 family protein
MLSLFDSPMFGPTDLLGLAPLMPATTGAVTGGRGRGLDHPCDILEHPTHFDIVCDTPGLGPENIKVELVEDTLVISGERSTHHKETANQHGVRVHRSERGFSKFTRSFTLPDNIKTEGISADVKNGILTVRLPKEEQKPAKAEPKRIKVTAAPGSDTGMKHLDQGQGTHTQEQAHATMGATTGATTTQG